MGGGSITPPLRTKVHPPKTLLDWVSENTNQIDFLIGGVRVKNGFWPQNGLWPTTGFQPHYGA